MRLRAWRTVRLRLVLLFMALAVATSTVFLVGLQRALAGGWQAWARPLLADYADRLVAEIGSPPDPARARAIADRLPVTVRIDGPAVTFASHPRPAWADGDEDDDDKDDDGRFGLERRTADGHRIVFGLAVPADRVRPRGAGLVALALLLGLTALAYLVVRRWLAPLQDIGAGAERYGRGDFARPIVVRRDDELGALAGGINRMADSLHGMLQARRTQLLAISHELRSPLTRARLNAELLPEGASREAIVRDLDAMRDLVSDLLESERLASGHAALQAEPADLAALAREAAGGRPLALQIDETLGPVRVDAARIRLLLRNLVDNALRHGAGGPPPQLVLRREADGMLALGVRDFGPSVEPAQLEKLAEPFYRPDSARTRAAGGVGLGLHLCRQVARAHGGELHLRNAAPGLEVLMRWRPRDA